MNSQREQYVPTVLPKIINVDFVLSLNDLQDAELALDELRMVRGITQNTIDRIHREQNLVALRPATLDQLERATKKVEHLSYWETAIQQRTDQLRTEMGIPSEDAEDSAQRYVLGDDTLSALEFFANTSEDTDEHYYGVVLSIAVKALEDAAKSVLHPSLCHKLFTTAARMIEEDLDTYLSEEDK